MRTLAGHVAEMTSSPIPLKGEMQVDGETVKWDRMSSSGLAIEFDYGERLHIGGDPTVERVKLAMQSYRIGHKVGASLGREQVRAEFRKFCGL